MANTAFLRPILFLFLSIGIAGCGSNNASTTSSAASSTPEEAMCISTQTISGSSTTVTGTATFQARTVTSTGLVGTSTAPIQHAEIHVYDSTGTLIQCGETSADGTYSLTVPIASGTYTVKVLSRADNSYYKARVLNNPTNNQYYSISQTYDPSSSSTGINLVASYTGTLEGGAFNIMEQIRIANERIRANSGTCVGCSTFTVADSIAVFWTPGLSPAAYYEQPGSAISFYLKAASGSLARGLYLLGGVQGNVDCVDTDHFDNSVILHEYGHYLEDEYAGSESPGGSHNGNMVIDPRLSWSEGWANFFQAFALDSSYYRDTIGNESCSAGEDMGVQLTLTSMASGEDKMPSNYSPFTTTPYFFNFASTSGEGIFREVSVSRLLHSLWRSTSGGVGLGFDEIWEVFSDTSSGIASSSVQFRNIGTYNQLMRSYLSTNAYTLTGYDAAVSAEYQVSDRTQYARPVTLGGSCTYSISAVNSVGDGSGYLYPHLQRSVDFYEYSYDGSNNSTIDLDNQSSENLQLLVYSADHVLWEADGLVDESATIGTADESVSLAGQPAGKYLIVVVNVTGQSTTHTSANYSLSSSGVSLCP